MASHESLCNTDLRWMSLSWQILSWAMSVIHCALLSMLIIKANKKKPPPQSFKVDLALLGVFGIGSYLFAFYWLVVLYWSEYYVIVLVLLVFLLLYMPLSFFLLCPKCGYNDICPMARVHKTFK